MRVSPGALLVTLVVTLGVRLVAMGHVDAAGIGDPNYYDDVAQAFARGEGLTSRCVWNLLALPADLPAPGCGYWGPGVPLVAGLAYRACGTALACAQGAMIALALVLAGFALALASRFALRPGSQLALGLLLAFHLQLTFFSVTVDTPIPFAVAVNACLLPLALAHAGWPPGFYLALPGALAAQLTRADGMLLPVLVFLFASGAWWRGRLSGRALVMLLAVYLAGFGVWLGRNAHAFGTPFPSSMAEGLFLADYSDLFRTHTRPTLARFLALGPQRILADKADALFDNLKTLAFGENKLILACAVLGFPALRRNPLAAPFLAYLASLGLAMTLAFNHQSKFGSLLHSLPSLFPFLGIAALVGVEQGLVRVATWKPGRHRFLARTLLGLAPFLLVMYCALQLVPSLFDPRGIGRPFRELAAVRRNLQEWWSRPGVGGPDVRVMSNDALDLLGMLPALVVQEPRDPGTEAVFELAARYRLKYFVVFRIPRYKSGIWDQPRYAHAKGELVQVGNLPAHLTEVELDGITLYEFRLSP